MCESEILYLYKDPLTGMNNLFALVECDIGSTFEDNGIILYADLINLSGVNEEHGRDVGNIYIKEFAEIIKAETSKYNTCFKNILNYRIGDDEFIIRFPLNVDFQVDEFARTVNCKLGKKMSLYGLEGTGIKFTIWSYSNKIGSLSDLLKSCILSLFETSEDGQMNIELPRWADHMIEYLLARVKDTIHLLQKSNSLALNDEISQLPNHRAATLYLKDVFEEYCINQTKFSILFVDGDNLKRYNDFGYHCGNEMIRDLGELITSSIRGNDKVFRWLSGDEFLIVLKDISKKTAYMMAERIRNYVEKTTKSWKYPVTVSIGVANCPTDGTDMNTILDKAISSNRQAKKSGKNCVM